MNGRKRVLVVDDDESIRDLVEDILAEDGYLTLKAAEADEAIEMFARSLPDMVILDIKLPGKDGFEILRWLRRRSNVPVIIVSGNNVDEPDRVKGLRMGADDYMVKPFSVDELKARVAAVLRRSTDRPRETGKVFDDGWLSIDLVKRKVTKAGEDIELTRTEYDVLQELASHAGEAVSYDQVLVAVWGQEYKGERWRVHDYVNSLRKKLESNSSGKTYIVNLPSFGYRFGSERQNASQSVIG